MNGLVPSPVRIIGTGLIGGSLGLALTAAGAEVQISDASPGAESLAEEMGVGTPAGPGSAEPELVIVAAPPDVAGALVADALLAHPSAFVTDVASVKGSVLDDVRARVDDEVLARYIGSHPMAGREVSGVIGARGDLFRARTYVIVPHEATDPAAVAMIRGLAVELGSMPVQLGPHDHDLAVAHVSHLPQIVSSLLGASLLAAPEGSLDLAGQGLRDTTRIAESDPRLWVEILGGNAQTLAPLARALRDDLTRVVAALEAGADGPGASRLPLGRLIADGNLGAARIPGKHGGGSDAFATVTILVPDAPGELARLFSDLGALDVNIEDVRLEHAHGSRVGLADVSVSHDSADRVLDGLPGRGWTIVDG